MIETVRTGITLVGTAHVSKRSVDDVAKTIRDQRPDKVLVELDDKRFQALQDPEAWKQTDIIQILREKKQHLFLLQLYLASMQARYGRETGSMPGAEMLEAVRVADEIGAEVVLIDRDVSITLRRGIGAMNFWNRLHLFWKIWSEVLTPTEEGDGNLDVDALLEQDAITAMTEEFASFAPVVKIALIDERDQYMASHIAEQATTHSVVAVVGAGHMPGIKRHLAGTSVPSRVGLDDPPPKRLTVAKVFGYALPLFVLGAFAYGLVTGDTAELKRNLLIWLLANGTLSALGAIIARGHILSILTAFVAAPLTSLSPALAAGWFAGLVEAKIHTPRVSDFENIKAIETLKDFWRNDVVRILLVTALANVGSVIGTYVAAGWIASSLGGP